MVHIASVCVWHASPNYDANVCIWQAQPMCVSGAHSRCMWGWHALWGADNKVGKKEGHLGKIEVHLGKIKEHLAKERGALGH